MSVIDSLLGETKSWQAIEQQRQEGKGYPMAFIIYKLPTYMKKTVYLTIIGFEQNKMYLTKPSGEQVALHLSQFDPSQLEGIDAMLKSGVKSWDNSGPASVQIVADVEVDDSGRYVDLAIMGYHLKND